MTGPRVVAPRGLVYTKRNEACAAVAGNEAPVTTVLPKNAGVTRLTRTIRYPSRDSRDAAIASGTERGVAVGFDKLQAYPASVA